MLNIDDIKKEMESGNRPVREHLEPGVYLVNIDTIKLEEKDGKKRLVFTFEYEGKEYEMIRFFDNPLNDRDNEFLSRFVAQLLLSLPKEKAQGALNFIKANNSEEGINKFFSMFKGKEIVVYVKNNVKYVVKDGKLYENKYMGFALYNIFASPSEFETAKRIYDSKKQYFVYVQNPDVKTSFEAEQEEGDDTDPIFGSVPDSSDNEEHIDFSLDEEEDADKLPF